MYPKQHAAVSGLSVLLFAVLRGIGPVEVLFWSFLGAVAGVLIDVDHALLSMFVKGRYTEGLKWFRDPLGAVLRPSEFLDDMDYDALIYHRILSHTAVLGLLLVLIDLSIWFIPIAAGIAVHIVCDLAYDLYNRSYWFQA